MSVESGWQLSRLAHEGRIPENHFRDLSKYQTSLDLRYEHNGLLLKFLEDWWKIPGSYPQYGQVVRLDEQCGDQTLIIAATINVEGLPSLRSIGSRLTPDERHVVHVVKGKFPRLGKPFIGMTGQETSIVRPLDEAVRILRRQVA